MVAQVDASYIKKRPWKLWSRLVSYAFFEGRPLTTRGQWINPFLFAHFALAKHLPQLKKVEKPLFILGTGRSGTTILGIVLSMHREIGFLNEPKALWHAIFRHEDLIGSYTRSPARYMLEECDAGGNVVQSGHRLFGAYLRASCSQRVVDKYPELIFRVPFVEKIFPDAKFLFLIRNGWDTCHSIDGWSERLGKQVNGEIHDWWGVNRRKWNFLVDQLVPLHLDLAPFSKVMREWTNQTDMAALEWILTMRQGLKLVEDRPNSVLQVNYEALCERPSEILKDICGYAELGQDEVFYEYANLVLRSTKPKSPLELASEIKEPFLETMRILGYK